MISIFYSVYCITENSFTQGYRFCWFVISKLWRFPIMIYLCVRLSVHPASLVQGVFSLPFTQFDSCLTHSVLGLNVCSDFEPSFKVFIKVIANFVESLSMPYNFFFPLLNLTQTSPTECIWVQKDSMSNVKVISDLKSIIFPEKSLSKGV